MASAAKVKRAWGAPSSDADVYVISERFGSGPTKSPVVTSVPHMSEVQWAPRTEDRSAWTSSELDAKHAKAKPKHAALPPTTVRDPQARAAALSRLRESSEQLGAELLAPAEAAHAARAAMAAESNAAASIPTATRRTAAVFPPPLLVIVIGGVALLGLLLVALRRS
jgi:hypothetical protein